MLRNPQLEPTAKAGILADLAGDDEPLFANFLRVVAEKGRAGELEEIAAEFERLIAREERRLTVELTTARELTDDEASAIVAQIEKAAGRKVEATRRSTPTSSAASSCRPARIASTRACAEDWNDFDKNS